MKPLATKSDSDNPIIYSVIDIETTGGNRGGNKITEIAIINFDGEKIIEEFQTLINPEMRIPGMITRLTGIDNSMVADAPKFYEVAKKIVEMTEGNIFVAHNVFFDFNFIKHEFSELGYQYKRDKLCTVRMGRKYIPGHKSYSLGKLCSDLGIEITARHRAYGDARATVEVLRLILNQNQKPELIKAESKKLNLPNKLKRSDYDELPHEVGVYYFYSDDGLLLYIGKSKDIKTRVLSHFRVDLKRAKDIQLKNQIARIEYKKTGNELAALLFESHEIKTLKPKFNHALRRKLFPIALELKKDKSGIMDFKVFTQNPNEKHTFLFKNKKAARRRIDSYYKSLLGYDQDHFDFVKAKDNLIDKVGTEQYNHMLEKIMNQKVPAHKDFDIKLPGLKKSETCLISVREHMPSEMVYIDNHGEIREEVELYQDQDMIGILQSFLTKKKLSITPIKNNFDIYLQNES